MPNQTLAPSPVPALRQRFDAVPWLPILLSPRGPYMAQTDAQGIPLRDDRGSLHVEETPGGVSGAWRRGAQVMANLRWLTPQRNAFDTELDVYGATRRTHGDVDGLSHYPYWTCHFPRRLRVRGARRGRRRRALAGTRSTRSLREATRSATSRTLAHPPQCCTRRDDAVCHA